MGGISTSGVRIPRWLKRIDRLEYLRKPGWRGRLQYGSGPDLGLDEALRESNRRLWMDAGFFALAAAAPLWDAWMQSHDEHFGRLNFVLGFWPVTWITLSSLIGSRDRWIGAMLRRSRNPGGVGPQWLARQPSLRHWHRSKSASEWVLGLVFVAVFPVAHAVYHPHPGEIRRFAIESGAMSADLLAYAAFTAFVFRRINRRCFETLRADLLAAEAQLAARHSPVADAAPSDVSSWGSAG